MRMIGAILCGTLLFSPIVAQADTIILKSGKSIQGKIIEKSDQAIKINLFVSGVTITLLPDEVYGITPDSANTDSLSAADLLSSNEKLKHVLFFLLGAALSDASHGAITPEDVRWPLLYYYRNKDKENLVTYLSAFLKDPQSHADPEQSAYVARFFSVAFKENAGELDRIKALKSNEGTSESEWLDSVIAGAQDFKVLSPNTVGNIRLLWADFRVTGDTNEVKKIISVLKLPQDDEHTDLISETEASLVLNCLRNIDARDVIKKEGGLLGESARPRIEAILYIVDALTELASTYLYRGYNYATLKQYDLAFEAYRSALQICPDYSYALNNLGNLYNKVKNDRQKLFLYIKSALYNNPENSSVAYALGIYHFEDQLYNDAIRYYQRALDYEPDKPEYNHAIARAYQEKGDVKNAVKYFQKYLALAPHGEHEQLVRAYLESVQAAPSQDLDDPGAMLQEGRYQDLEKYLNELLKQHELDENGFSKLSKTVEELVQPKAMGVPMEERLDLMMRWIKAKPQSHFANLVLGIFYSAYAWEARGSGFSDTVTKKGGNLFVDRLLKSQEYLSKAYNLNPADAIAPANMLDVTLGLGFEFDEMEKWFQRAIQADPNEYEAYQIKLMYLMPKWHGSQEQMFAFARESAEKALPKTLIPIVVAEAHWEMHWRDISGKYFKNNPDAWKETKKIYERILRDFPKANYHRNRFALAAYYAADFAAAREQFALIRNEWDPEVWKSKKIFEHTRGEVQEQVK